MDKGTDKGTYTLYTLRQYQQVLKLRESGLSPKKISKLTGIKIPTVAKWVYSSMKPLAAYSTHPSAKIINIKQDVHFAYIYGVLLGDASLCVGKIQLNAVDIGFIKKFRHEMFDWTGFKCSKITKRKAMLQLYPNGKVYSRKPIYRTYFCSVRLVRYLQEIRKTSTLPTFTKQEKIAFIEGFFDSEGHVIHTQTRNELLYAKFGFTNTNKELLESIRKILNEFEISSNKLSTSINHSGRPCYTLYITNRIGCKKFAEIFSCSIRRKQKILDKFKVLDLTKKICVCSNCGYKSEVPSAFRGFGKKQLCNNCYKQKHGYSRKMNRTERECRECGKTYSLSINKLSSNKGLCPRCRVSNYRGRVGGIRKKLIRKLRRGGVNLTLKQGRRKKDEADPLQKYLPEEWISTVTYLPKQMRMLRRGRCTRPKTTSLYTPLIKYLNA